MSDYSGLSSLMDEIRQCSDAISLGDSKFTAGLKSLESSVNDLYRQTHRPGAEWHSADDEAFERKSATEMCRVRRALNMPRDDGLRTTEYVPGSGEIDEALAARRAFKQMIRHGDVAKLDNLERKSLSAFSFGNNGFLSPPERSNQVLSCLSEPSDLSGLINRVQISAGSVKFFIDNARMGLGAWACDATCFANNPTPDLQAGLGELEIKAEPIRFVTCATSDLLQDAAFPVESWLFDRVNTGMSAVINEAILVGDGAGKPLGLLHPRLGVPRNLGRHAGRSILVARSHNVKISDPGAMASGQRLSDEPNIVCPPINNERRRRTADMVIAWE